VAGCQGVHGFAAWFRPPFMRLEDTRKTMMALLKIQVGSSLDGRDEAWETPRVFLFLAALLVAGAVLRLYNLDALGLTNDESVQGVAVKGILTNGYPTLGSGSIYVRALPHLYLQALCAWFFGWGETALRLPSVLFNLATIVLIYFFTRDLLGQKTALVAATLATFSAWMLEFSRVGRMYTSFQFAYLLSYYTYFQGFILGHRVYRYLTFFSFFFAFTLHQLSFPLVFSFLFLACLHPYSRQSRLRIFFYTMVAFWMYFLYWYLVGHLFPGQRTAGNVFSNPNNTHDILSSIYLQVSQRISLPSLTLFQQFSTSLGAASIFFIMIISLFTTLSIYLISSKMTFYDYIFLILIMTSCLFHQIGLAAILVLFYILLKGHFGHLEYKVPLYSSMIIFLSFIGWSLYGIYNSQWYINEIRKTSHFHRVLAVILEYPHLYDKYGRFLIEAWPFFSVWMFIGVIALLIRHIMKPDLRILYILGICYLSPFILLSLFGDDRNQPRFYFHLYGIMIIFFSYTSLVAIRWILLKLQPYWNSINLPRHSISISIISAIFFCTLLNDDIDILHAIEISQRTYKKYNVVGLKSLNYYRPFEVDYRTCSCYVKENLRESDIIISFGPPVTRYVYTGRVDYFIKRNSDSLVTGNTNSVHLPSLEELHKVIYETGSRRVWILGDECTSVPNWYTNDMCDYLVSLESHAVCRGVDGMAAVYLLDHAE
jgi:hypothetical protein